MKPAFWATRSSPGVHISAPVMPYCKPNEEMRNAEGQRKGVYYVTCTHHGNRQVKAIFEVQT
jgi:hypothetical protein